MNHRQQFCFFGVLFLGAMNFSDVASAQFAPDPFFYRKPHEIAPQKYRKQNDGTILERKTGNIYDRKGNLLRRGNDTSYSTPSRPQNQSYPSNSLNARYVQVINASPSLEKFCARTFDESWRVTYGPGDLVEIGPLQRDVSLKFRQDFSGTAISAVNSICGR